MKNKGCRHNFGIRPAKEYHNSRQTKEWQMLVCFVDDPLQNGCLVVIITKDIQPRKVNILTWEIYERIHIFLKLESPSK
jgi:hypothetical protein